MSAFHFIECLEKIISELIKIIMATNDLMGTNGAIDKCITAKLLRQNAVISAKTYLRPIINENGFRLK